jgi:hypothetical protein
MGYKQRPTVRIDLVELGDNNGTPFFVDIKNPKLLTFQERMEFAKTSRIDDFMEKINSMKDLAKDFIVSWNLLDLSTEQPISPTVENALDQVPSEVVEAIMKRMNDSSKKEDEEIKN